MDATKSLNTVFAEMKQMNLPFHDDETRLNDKQKIVAYMMALLTTSQPDVQTVEAKRLKEKIRVDLNKLATQTQEETLRLFV